MLKLLLDAGCELDLVINKPRTVLDAKAINCDLQNFPEGSIESEVLASLDSAEVINPKRIFSIRQITGKRAWW